MVVTSCFHINFLKGKARSVQNFLYHMHVLKAIMKILSLPLVTTSCSSGNNTAAGFHRRDFEQSLGKGTVLQAEWDCITVLTPVKFCQSYHHLMICFWLVNFFEHGLIAESKHENFSRSAKSQQTFRSVDHNLETTDLIHLPSWWLTTNGTSSLSGVMN